MPLFKTRDDVDEYNDLLAECNDLLAEVARLSAIIGDQQILLDEHRMDNQHAHKEGGNAERAAVVAFLRGKFPEWPAGTNGFADEVERGEHRSKET